MKYKNNKAFTLVEIIVSIVVMSSMMAAMLNLIYFCMDTWKKGQSKLNANMYNRMVYEVIKKDLLNAGHIFLPVGEASATLVYTVPAKNKYGNTDKINIEIATGTTIASNSILFKRVIGDEGGFTINNTDLDDGSADTIFSRHFNMTISRKVMNFQVRRISSFSMQVSLQLGEPSYDDVDFMTLTTVSSQTMTFLTPGG